MKEGTDCGRGVLPVDRKYVNSGRKIVVLKPIVRYFRFEVGTERKMRLAVTPEVSETHGSKVSFFRPEVTSEGVRLSPR